MRTMCTLMKALLNGTGKAIFFFSQEISLSLQISFDSNGKQSPLCSNFCEKDLKICEKYLYGSTLSKQVTAEITITPVASNEDYHA